MRWHNLVGCLLFCFPSLGYTQQTSQSITFSSGSTVASVQMTGTAIWQYGSDQQTGTVSLSASADGQSRMELQLDRGLWVETQDAFSNVDRKCAWQAFDSSQHQIAFHNCQLGVIWFLPQITLQAGEGPPDASISVTTSPAGATRVHCERHPADVPDPAAAAFITRLSTTDLDLDSAGLPEILIFSVHPDADASTDIPAEIRLSDYRAISGVQLPFRVQKLINGTIILDLQLSSVQVQFAQ